MFARLKFLNYTFLTVLVVDLLATAGDITLTWTSPIFPKLTDEDHHDHNAFARPITANEESWIGSLLDVGAIIGAIPFAFIADRWGRRFGLIAIAIPHIVSYLILAFAKVPELYYFARFIGGVAVGGGYALLPMYIAEVAEDSNRGMLSNTLNMFWTFGNLIPYVIGPYLPIMWFNIILACIPASFLLLFILIAPETPYFLLTKNREKEAKQSLLKLRSNQEKLVELEIDHIKAGLEKEEQRGTFLDLFRTRVALKALGISVVVIMAQQLSGIDAVLFYTQKIFINAGVADVIPPEICAIIIGFISFCSSFVAPALADRSGRRFLLLFSCCGSALAHIASGFYFFIKDNTDLDTKDIRWLPILFLVLYITTFYVGLGCIPWTVSAELFPTNVKPFGASLVAAISWSTSFVVTKFYNDMNSGLGQGGTFWLFAGFCIASFIFVYFFLPETRGKSFEEIQVILNKKQRYNH